MAYPVVTGVPFAMGVLADLAKLRLEKAGVEVPMTARSLCQWPDDSYKSVEIAYLGESGDMTYTLHYGGSTTRSGGVNVAVPSVPGTLTMIHTDGGTQGVVWTTINVITAPEGEQNHVRCVSYHEGTIGTNMKVRVWVTQYANFAGTFVDANVWSNLTDPTWGGDAPVRKKKVSWFIPTTLTGSVSVGLDEKLVTASTATALASVNPRWLETGVENRQGPGAFKNYHLSVINHTGSVLDACNDNPVAWVSTQSNSVVVTRDTTTLRTAGFGADEGATVSTRIQMLAPSAIGPVAGASAGLVAQHVLAAPVDLSGARGLSLWIKSSRSLATGNLKLELSANADGSAPLESLTILGRSASHMASSIPSNAWNRVSCTFVNADSLTAIQSIALRQPVSLGAYTLNLEDIVPEHAERLNGWIQTATTGVALRWCYQQFPKAIGALPTGIVLDLHPDDNASKGGALAQGGDFHYSKPGGATSYQFLVYSGTGMSLLQDLLNDPPRVLPPLGYISSSNVYGGIWPNDATTQAYHRGQVANWTFLNGSLPQIQTSIDYGFKAQAWGREFGNQIRPDGEFKYYNGTHVGHGQYTLNTLMTGDWRWVRWTEPEAYRAMDLGMCNSGRSGHDYIWGNLFGPGEILCEGHTSTRSQARLAHVSHFHMSALPELWLLTGNRRIGQALRATSEWQYQFATKHVFQGLGKFAANQCPPSGAYSDTNRASCGAEREKGWPLHCLNKAYQSLGLRKYHDAGVYHVWNLIARFKWKTAYWNNGVIQHIADWEQGTSYFRMRTSATNGHTPHTVNEFGEFDYGHENAYWNRTLYTGNNAWMLASCIHATIQWLKDEAVLGYPNVSTIPNCTVEHIQRMCLQWVNHIWKWSYNGGNQLRYGEWDPASFRNIQTDIPTAWYVRQIQAGVPNSQWYDMYDRARTAMLASKTAFASPTGSYGAGIDFWYGYNNAGNDFFDDIAAIT